MDYSPNRQAEEFVVKTFYPVPGLPEIESYKSFTGVDYV